MLIINHGEQISSEKLLVKVEEASCLRKSKSTRPSCMRKTISDQVDD